MHRERGPLVNSDLYFDLLSRLRALEARQLQREWESIDRRLRRLEAAPSDQTGTTGK